MCSPVRLYLNLSTSADLSGLPGWDSASGTITGYVTVVVSSLDSTSEEYVSDEDRDSYEYEESDEKEKEYFRQ